MGKEEFEKPNEAQASLSDCRADPEESPGGEGALRKRLAESEREAGELRAALEESRAQASAAQKEAETLRAQVETAREETESLRTQAETARAEAESARAEAETARAEAEAMRAQADTARAEAEEFRSKERERIRDAAVRRYLSEKGVPEEAMPLALRGMAEEIGAAEIPGENGKGADFSALDALLDGEFSFLLTGSSGLRGNAPSGINTATPPLLSPDAGGTSRADILAIRDGGERRRAIAEHPGLFGL